MRIVVDENLSVAWRVGKKDFPKLSAAVFVKALFKLTPGVVELFEENEFPITGDLFTDDDAEKSLRYPSDFALFKPRADVLVVGRAHAPDKVPVRKLQSTVRVGKMSKTIEVLGDRTWKNSLLGMKSEPEPFVSMPLDYEHAFGGKKDKKNPVGKGRDSDPPNLELPGRHITNATDSAEAACFAPVAATWQQRSSLVGTYGRKYQQERWPWFPEDFDWGHFNAAPRDQQVEGYLHGDEEIELLNLVPTTPHLKTRLPGRRARWFINERLPDGSLRYHEVPLHLDTLWIDTDKNWLALVWRGLVDAPSMRLRQFEQMLVVSETFAKPLGSTEAFREEFLLRMTAEAREIAEAQARQDDNAEGVEATLREQAAESQALMEANKAPAPAAVVLETNPSAAGSTATGAATNGTSPSSSSNGAPSSSEGAAEKTAQVEAHLSAIGVMIAELVAQRDQLVADGAGSAHPQVVELEHKVETMKEAERHVAATKPMKREQVVAGAAQGASFAGRDLSDLDLTGVQLTGLDFTECNFSGTKLVRADLRTANLTRATVSGTDLSGADLSQAVLEEALFFDAVLTKTKLVGAKLGMATLSKCDLTGADFSDSVGKGVGLDGAKLAGAQFSRAKLISSDFDGAELEGAVFRDCDLNGTSFAGVKAKGVIMEGSDLSRLQGSDKADFTEANFRKVKADGSIWETCTLDRADFSDARLERAVFTEASLRETRCERAHLVAADFADAVLEKANFRNANLLRASFDRAILTKADFRDANMFEAGFWEATGDEIDFRGANLKSTLRG